MEQYPVHFFTSFLESLQRLCRDSVNFSQFVEIHGYFCVEIDNVKKERYVLSELLQSSGNVVSESYCTKAFTSGGQNGHRETDTRTPSERNDWESQSYSHSKTGSENWSSPVNAEGKFQRKRSRQHNQENLETYTPSSSRRVDNYKSLMSQSPLSPHSQFGAGHEGHVTLWESEHGDGQTQMGLVTESPSFTDTVPSSVVDPDEVIDLDMIDDDVDSSFPGEETLVTEHHQTAPDQFCSSVQLRKTNLSPGTLNVIRHSVKQFKRFHFEKSWKDIDLLSTPPERLNVLLLEYFKDAKKIGGGELTPRSLKNVQAHLEMFLRDGGYPYSVSKDKQFQSSRDFLKKKLMDSGKIVTQKFSPVDNQDIETMFCMNQLGLHNPDCRCFVNFYKQYKAMRPKIAQDADFPFYLKVNKLDNEQWFLPAAMGWNPFTTIWRKLVLGSGLPVNKKIM